MNTQQLQAQIIAEINTQRQNHTPTIQALSESTEISEIAQKYSNKLLSILIGKRNQENNELKAKIIEIAKEITQRTLTANEVNEIIQNSKTPIFYETARINADYILINDLTTPITDIITTIFSDPEHWNNPKHKENILATDIQQTGVGISSIAQFTTDTNETQYIAIITHISIGKPQTRRD